MSDTAAILFVDDDDWLLAGLRRQLRAQRHPWRLHFVASADDALALLERDRIDVVVTDLSMPGLSGIELVQHINRAYPQIRCLMLTGTADLQTATDVINTTRVFRFYTKPCPAREIAAGIAAALAAPGGEPADAAGQLSLDILDRLSLGVVVLGCDGTVKTLNKEAAAILAAEDGLYLGRQGGLRCGHPDQTRALSDLIDAAADPAAAPADDTGALALPRRDDKPPLTVIAAPIAHDDSLALFLADPTRRPLPDAGFLAAYLGLTLAEAGLVARLCAGMSLEDAAHAQDITLGTARTYVKRIFVKTGTRRQAELVQRALTGAPVV